MVSRRLLAVFAHPDDETFRPGGTLALLARGGVCVSVRCATRGEAGSPGELPVCELGDLPAVREKELLCACAALGLEPPRVLDYRDGHLAETEPEQIVARLRAMIRELQPQVMLSFGSDGLSGHPDHIAIGRCASEAFACETGVAALYDVAGLSKTFLAGKDHQLLRAVDGIDFAVQQGEVFGFLGPNGAGKTTTIRMLTGLTRPTAGSAHILGFDLSSDVARIKKRIGVVPEASNLYDELSAFDNLIFSMQLYGVPRPERAARAEALLKRFRLTEKRDAPFAKLSRGMKRALTIAAALAHRPALVFLDEPTTGLDVMSARGLLGLTVLFSTSSMEAIVIVFERRIGSLERLLLAPIRLPALLAGKMLGGMAFGLTVTAVVLAVSLAGIGFDEVSWLGLAATMVLSAAAFSAMGAFVSVAVREVFEAQTLANVIRFPMMFLGGVFVPVASLPAGLQLLARLLPLTYSVEAFETALNGGPWALLALDLAALAAFTLVLFALAVRVLARSLE